MHRVKLKVRSARLLLSFAYYKKRYLVTVMLFIKKPKVIVFDLEEIFIC